MKKLMMGICLAVTLTGCGGGPSKGDIESAFLADLQKIDPNAKIENLEVGDCEKRNDAPGFACAISIQTSMTMMGVPIANENAATVIMEKVGDEWKMIGTL